MTILNLFPDIGEVQGLGDCGGMNRFPSSFNGFDLSRSSEKGMGEGLVMWFSGEEDGLDGGVGMHLRERVRIFSRSGDVGDSSVISVKKQVSNGSGIFFLIKLRSSFSGGLV